MDRGSQQHLRSLTSLRFLAAALVVVYHAAAQSSLSYNPGALLRFGGLGVTFFFVLSGIVLVWSARDGDAIGSFYRRRFARVWPLHALTFTLAALLGLAGLIDHYGPIWAAPVNLALLQAWAPQHDVVFSFNGLSWSLSDEAFFYALFPALYLAGRRFAGAAMLAVGASWLVIGGVVAELTGYAWFAPTFPAYRVGEFVVGMGLGLLLRRGYRMPVHPAVAMAMAAGSYSLLVVLNRLSAGWLVEREWVAALIVLPGMVLVLLAFAARDLDGGRGVLTQPWLVRLGQWSFALYMVHDPVLRVARPVMLEHRWVTAMAVVVSVALSGLLYEFFERPVERRLRGRGRSAAQLKDART